MPRMLRTAGQTRHMRSFTKLILCLYTMNLEADMYDEQLCALPVIVDSLKFLSQPKRCFRSSARRPFVWDEFTDYEVKANLRFEKKDFGELADALDLPETMRTRKGDVFSWQEGLVILLYRLSFPNTWGAHAIAACPLARAKGGAASARPATGWASDGHKCVAALPSPPRPRRHSPSAVRHRRADRNLSFLRGRCRTACIRIFYHMLDIMYSFKPAIDDINRWKDDMPLFARLIYEAGSSLSNCPAMFDGTFQRHCKPGGGIGGAALGLQRECWNPYYNGHGIKFQGVTIPNGMYGELYGAPRWRGTVARHPLCRRRPSRPTLRGSA